MKIFKNEFRIDFMFGYFPRQFCLVIFKPKVWKEMGIIKWYRTY